MTDDVQIPANEYGVTRIFALNMTPEDAEALKSDPERLKAVLGAQAVDPARVDVIAARVLSPLGLSTYLIDGMGLPEEAISEDRARLDALDGHVMIVRSEAFGGVEQTLSLGAEATLVGEYRDPLVVPSFEPLRSETARGQLDPGAVRAPAPAPGRTPPTLWIALGLVLAAFVVAGLVALLT